MISRFGNVAQEPIAVIGLAARFPGASTAEILWEHLLAGRELLTETVDSTHFALREGEHFVRRGGYLESPFEFDADFFGISPREAAWLDPQQRIFLELSYEALESSGYTRGCLDGRVGVFAGTRPSTWLRPGFTTLDKLDRDLILTGNADDSVATRVAYKLDLRGPAMSVQTFCSSSAVAIHLAISSLRANDCDLALAGGVCIRFPHRAGYVYTPGGVLSPTGRCFTFDERANGTIFSDGAGVLSLRRLEDALKDNDPILAIIRSSAINNDGSNRTGFTAPSARGQAAVIADALAQAGLCGEDIGLVEAHGTATIVGDRIEVRALRKAFGPIATQSCALGSIKTNLGHSESAAGIAGLTKAILALKHRTIPPSINFDIANPLLDLNQSPFYVPREPSYWAERNDRRLAGVSSFGFGATNVHFILEEAPQMAPSRDDGDWQYLTISAKSDTALDALLSRLDDFLTANSGLSIADVAYTLQTGRESFGRRVVIIAKSLQEACCVIRQARRGVRPISSEGIPSEIQAWSEGKIDHLSVASIQGSRRRVHLPTYPFQRQPFPPIDLQFESPTSQEEKIVGQNKMQLSSSSGKAPYRSLGDKMESDTVNNKINEINEKIKQIFANVLGVESNEIRADDDIIELGADSILLYAAIDPIKNEFGLKITVKQFLTDLNTISKISAHIVGATKDTGPDLGRMVTMYDDEDEQPYRRELARSHRDVKALADGTGAQSPAESVIREQLLLMRQQLALLSGAPLNSEEIVPSHISENEKRNGASAAKSTTDASRVSIIAQQPAPNKAVARIGGLRDAPDTESRRDYLRTFVPEYVSKTTKSKEHANHCRPSIADSRSSIGYRRSIKELVYPLVSARSSGSRVWDIDDNEYVDMTMGFGVHLFGHNPSFINEALIEQVKAGFGIGLRNERAHEVARRILDLTGMDRVAFVNDGTEAIMNAVRVARASTNKNGLLLFSSGYHGHWDSVIAKPSPSSHISLGAAPLAAGVPAGTLGDVAVGEYGSESALEFIRLNRNSLAAVLVEPVTTLRPKEASRRYLQQLREVTAECGILLIFDEIVTGFRCHPGGVQGLYGIEADIVTYGKIVGGGLPIGVIAGRGDLLDPIDGGIWHFGDDSYPSSQATFFGGTFFQHPLTLTTANAVLRHLQESGPDLQLSLNSKTAAFAERTNAWFQENGFDIEVQAFSSFFRLVHSQNLDLLYFSLIKRGIYIWEWRCWFISTAHTDEDLKSVEVAIQETLVDLRVRGLC